MNVGDLYWVELPASGGHAQAGRSPAISAQEPTALPTVFIVPVTSQFHGLRCPGTVLVEAIKENGLRHNSVALVFQLTAVDRRYLTDRLGKASDQVMQQIWQAFDSLTGRA